MQHLGKTKKRRLEGQLEGAGGAGAPLATRSTFAREAATGNRGGLVDEVTQSSSCFKLINLAIRP